MAILEEGLHTACQDSRREESLVVDHLDQSADWDEGSCREAVVVAVAVDTVEVLVDRIAGNEAGLAVEEGRVARGGLEKEGLVVRSA